MSRFFYLAAGNLRDRMVNDAQFDRSVIKIGKLAADFFHQVRMYAFCRVSGTLHDRICEQVMAGIIILCPGSDSGPILSVYTVLEHNSFHVVKRAS